MKKNILFLTLIFFLSFHSHGQTLSAFPSYETAGLKIILPSGYDSDKNSQTIVEYKKSSQSNWLKGFHMDRITAQSIDQFRGSLFGLDEYTSYDVRITLVDSVPVITTNTLATLTFTTLNSPTFVATGNIKWVSPTGSGTAYTEANPGNIKVLLSSGTVACGTTIYVKDGTYFVKNMTLNVTTDCSENTPIQILAAPGASPIFDGSYQGTLNWTQNPNDPKLFSASLPSGCDYTNICSINGNLLYPYPTLTSNVLTGGYNLSALNFGADGFVRDGSNIWLKTDAGLNPNTSSVVISEAFRWFTVYGNDHSPYLKISGLTIKNYGKTNVSGTVAYTGMAADFRIVNNIIFDRCEFIHNNADIRFDGACNQLLIQNCEFVNNNGLFTHAMAKKSNVQIATIPTSYGRGKETGAVKIFETKGLVLRGNAFKGVNSGVVSAYETGFVEEVDIYDNFFENNFDAIECDGFWANLRVVRNELVAPMAAFSIAQPKIGPRYFYRNVVHHLKGRRNEQDDPYYIGCTPPTEYWQAGIAIKTNSGPVVGDSANLYFFNNTFHSEDSLGFLFTLWDAEWKTIDFINNIVYDEWKHVGYFHDLANKPNFQMNWNTNNLYTNAPNQPIFVAKEIHGQFNCHSLMNVNQLASELNTISGSSKISFTNTISVFPYFTNTSNGGFSLTSGSPMINVGITIDGFYDYHDLFPDLGAKEGMPLEGIDETNLENSILLFPNPTNGSFTIDVKKFDGKAELKIFDLSGKLVPSRYTQNGSLISVDETFPSGVYFVQISVGGLTKNLKLVVR